MTQLVLDLYGCRGEIDDLEALEAAILAGCREVGATVVKLAHYTYSPHGLTLVAILLESHVVVSTWPEHRFATVEIFLCNRSMNPQSVARPIAAVLRPTRRRSFRLTHHIAPMPRAVVRRRVRGCGAQPHVR